MSSHARREARRESLWLLWFGCALSLCLALCGKGPSARADTAAAARKRVRVASASASASAATPALDTPSMVRLTHGLSAGVDGQPVPESDRPPGALPN